MAVVYVLHHFLDDVIVNIDLLDIELRFLWHVVHSSLSLSLLELERDVANRSLLDSLHKMGDETGDLVSESLGRDDSNLFGDLLVELEVQSELLVVLLNDVSRGSLNCLGSDASHSESELIA